MGVSVEGGRGGRDGLLQSKESVADGCESSSEALRDARRGWGTKLSRGETHSSAGHAPPSNHRPTLRASPSVSRLRPRSRCRRDAHARQSESVSTPPLPPSLLPNKSSRESEVHTPEAKLWARAAGAQDKRPPPGCRRSLGLRHPHRSCRQGRAAAATGSRLRQDCRRGRGHRPHGGCWSGHPGEGAKGTRLPPDSRQAHGHRPPRFRWRAEKEVQEVGKGSLQSPRAGPSHSPISSTVFSMHSTRSAAP